MLCYGPKIDWFIKLGLYSMRAYTRAYADCRRSCLYFCRRLRRVHTPTVAVKVQTCWTFKASADQRRHSSQSRKRSKVSEGRRVVLHRKVCGRIPTHTLACLYFYPRCNLRYAVATHRQPQAWTSAPAAGAYGCMKYKPGFNVSYMFYRSYLLQILPAFLKWIGKWKESQKQRIVDFDGKWRLGWLYGEAKYFTIYYRSTMSLQENMRIYQGNLREFSGKNCPTFIAMNQLAVKITRRSLSFGCICINSSTCGI